MGPLQVPSPGDLWRQRRDAEPKRTSQWSEPGSINARKVYWFKSVSMIFFSHFFRGEVHHGGQKVAFSKRISEFGRQSSLQELEDEHSL